MKKKLIRKPVKADLVLDIPDPDDPEIRVLVEALFAALPQLGRITVTGVKVEFPDSAMLQSLWRRVLRGGSVLIEFEAGRAKVVVPGMPDRAGAELIREYIYREGGTVWMDFSRADSNGRPLRWLLVALGMPDDPQTGTALRALSKIRDPYGSEIWDAEKGRFNLNRLAELVREGEQNEFWMIVQSPDLPSVGPTRMALIIQFADRDWDDLVN